MKSTTAELFGLLSTIKVSIYLYLMDSIWWFYGGNMIISFQLVNGLTSTYPVSRFIHRFRRKICFHRAKIVIGNWKINNKTNKKQIVNISLLNEQKRQLIVPIRRASFQAQYQVISVFFSSHFSFLLRGRMKHLNWNTTTGCSIINNSLLRLKQSQVS